MEARWGGAREEGIIARRGGRDTRMRPMEGIHERKIIASINLERG